MRKYRVECNFGSRYFETAVKALSYYNKKKSQNLNVELWLIACDYDAANDCFSATQELIDYSCSKFPK